MNKPSDDLTRRLLYILHRGFVQVRNLALAEGNTQIAELADAMEIIPTLMDRWDEEHLELIRFALKTYEDKYPGGTYNHVADLTTHEVPQRY